MVDNRHDLTSARGWVTGPSQRAAREALVSGKRCQATVSGKGMGEISRPPRRHHVAVRWRAGAREGISGDCVHTFGCWTFRFGSHSPAQSGLHNCSAHHVLHPALPTRILSLVFHPTHHPNYVRLQGGLTHKKLLIRNRGAGRDVHRLVSYFFGRQAHEKKKYPKVCSQCIHH